MSVRSNHSRQSSPYVAKTIDDKTYHFYPYDWHSSKYTVRYVANKVGNGNLTIPAGCQVYSDITIVYVKSDNTLSAVEE